MKRRSLFKGVLSGVVVGVVETEPIPQKPGDVCFLLSEITGALELREVITSSKEGIVAGKIVDPEEWMKGKPKITCLIVSDIIKRSKCLKLPNPANIRIHPFYT